MIVKRIFDLIISLLGLVILSPLLALIGIAIILDSRGPILFLQTRVGRNEKLFSIIKFRTMTVCEDASAMKLSSMNDLRVTRLGAVLRKYKLDELPQLFNVLIGDMSIVGPRPEVQKYIAFYSVKDRQEILSLRPGMTDWASIKFKDENILLGNAVNLELVYIEKIIPIKIIYYREYVNNRSMLGDLAIIASTIAAVFFERS